MLNSDAKKEAIEKLNKAIDKCFPKQAKHKTDKPKVKKLQLEKAS